jgi:hypothetical protein
LEAYKAPIIKVQNGYKALETWGDGDLKSYFSYVSYLMI